jgi:chemotaxis protein methyltransferase CheR
VHISDEELEMLVADVHDLYGYDFSGYARASLKRRFERLFGIDKFLSFAEFRYKILKDPVYIKRVVEEITVNVTEMFRDPHFYQTLRDDVLPVLATYPFIRIWLAGVSTGEEAYSIAILLYEANLLHKSLIYATDINAAVLESARKGIFPAAKMKQYSENYIAAGGRKDFSSYYTARYGYIKFDDDLSRKMIFSTHNLVSDSTFNEFQVIICRNVLIYFDKTLQDRVFHLFNESLDKFGFLALGAKETLKFSGMSQQYKLLKPGEKIWRKTT